MKHRIITTLAAAALLVVGMTSDAHAVTVEKARWQGTFDVTQKYVFNDLNSDDIGVNVKRVHTVRSSCAGTKACATVKFTRVAGTGDKFTYPLDRVKPGVYKGHTSYENSWWCTIDGDVVYTWTGTQDEYLTLKATDQRNGKVSKYKGTATLLNTPYVISEDVPQECQDYFASIGYEDGHRPTSKLAMTGVLR